MIEREPIKRILVTGASGALGRSIYEHFHGRGDFEVFGQHFRHPVEGRPTLRCDLRSMEQVRKLVETIEPDIIIHAAGVNYDGMSWKLSEDAWRDTMLVNLSGAWNLARLALPRMKSQGYGRIIFLSSVVGSVGIAGTSAYAASKAGLEGLTRALAAEVAKRGVTVNALRLGYVQTDENGMLDVYDAGIKERLVQRIPVGGFGTPPDVIKAVRFVIEAGWMTGAIMTLDGGQTGIA